MLQRLVLISMLTTCFLALPSFADQPPNKTAKYWLLEQKNRFYGDYKVYVSPKAIKVVCTKNGWIDIAKAPDWDVYVLGSSTKSYYRWDIRKFRTHPLTTMMTRIKSDTKPLKTKEEGSIAGLAAIKYIASGADAARGEVSSSDFWVAKNLVLPQQAIHIMCCNAGLPELNGVPLRVRATLESEGYQLMLDTTSAQLVSLSNEFFTVPSNFRPAKRIEDVMLGGAGMKEMIEEFSK
jgi:hypothetical protein